MKMQRMKWALLIALGSATSLALAQQYNDQDMMHRDQRPGDHQMMEHDHGPADHQMMNHDHGPQRMQPGMTMRHDEGPGDQGEHRGWRRGDRLPAEYRDHQYVIDDWHEHHLNRPPRGYHWVEVGGDYLLVSIGSGIVLQIGP
ncbi:RcnB family protein [Burkholderia guangdongensis]|uniref:RcnB family protein n=1 Tax=Burkholderia guangdongensis TaxID=1792500 RepID=UPI0015C8ED4B|nr:RcnB family protein [Burkholderia guangdongensis]